MKRLGILVLGIAALGAGCGDDSPTAPSAQPHVFSALLAPANEVPIVLPPENTGRGAMQVSLNVTRNASGAITAATANFHVQFIDFPGGVRTIGAHIHSGVAGVAGPVRVDTGLTTANPLVLDADGITEMNVSGITVDPVIAQGIIDNPSAWYFNVHSPLNPGGFMRGQLVRVR